MTEMYDDVQPLPSSMAREKAHEQKDPRLTCWFDGDDAVALAPRLSGGDDDQPAHWVPVCQWHCDQWHDETDLAERLPIIPRNGVALTAEQAESVLARISYYVENRDESVDEAEQAAYEALVTGLQALSNGRES